MKPWQVTFAAQDPVDPLAQWKVGVTKSKFRLIHDSGDEKKLARLLLVEQVVRAPNLIIRGWDRPAKNHCLVYVGRPKSDYPRIKIETPAPPGMLFLVFVMSDGMIDDWNWRRAKHDNPDLPEGLGEELIWPAKPT